ncbi:hypothetical protein FO440_06810 [Mucilaginibacter corticis]|uniref:Uncharacterized protein n=1 Tax=Mucilaginibacter corticis TaxID=2597670 RepID=A0A556MVC1_9SPHI|nr:hypothetical protein [Mucilaginibacter corticis]TSJ43890.1 hypothetical protein FO440_06810 [Mucilaginibacter corticis]
MKGWIEVITLKDNGNLQQRSVININNITHIIEKDPSSDRLNPCNIFFNAGAVLTNPVLV